MVTPARSTRPSASASASKTHPPVLQARNVSRDFKLRRSRTGRVLRAVDDVTLSLFQGQTLGIVGESGSGKSTLARCLVALLKPTSGEVLLDGVSVHGRTSSSRTARTQMQMVFQDPASSLDPRLTIGYSLGEPIRARDRDWRDQVERIFDDVGLPQSVFKRYPHELSGGQQQRVGIARALIGNPRLVVHDEPVSSLDVSLQAQIINLLLDLQASRHASYIFISHDLGVVQAISTRVLVMYGGRVVEQGPAADLMIAPLHPYTFALVGSVPSLDPVEARAWMAARVPGPTLEEVGKPSGCRFRERCPLAQEICSLEEPELVQERPDHWVACHFPGELSRDRIHQSASAASTPAPVSSAG